VGSCLRKDFPVRSRRALCARRADDLPWLQRRRQPQVCDQFFYEGVSSIAAGVQGIYNGDTWTGVAQIGLGLFSTGTAVIGVRNFCCGACFDVSDEPDANSLPLFLRARTYCAGKLSLSSGSVWACFSSRSV